MHPQGVVHLIREYILMIFKSINFPDYLITAYLNSIPVTNELLTSCDTLT